MGCSGSKGAKKVEKDPDDKFIDEPEIQELKIEDFDTAFGKGEAPLAGVVDLNNQLMGAIDQIFAAAAALFGAYIGEATFEGGKVSFEINKPPEKEGDKKVVIVTVTGEDKAKKDTGIKVVSKELYDGAAKGKTGPALVAALEKSSVLLGALNAALTAAGASMEIEIKANRVVQKTKKAPAEKDAKAKFNAAVVAILNFNAGYFSVKSNLCKAVFEDGLSIKKIVNGIIEKLKAAVGELKPTVNVDLAGLAEGKLNFDIGLPNAPNINEFISTNDAIPMMLKKAWGHIAGPEGLIETMKGAAATLVELKPQIEEATQAIQDLPTDPKEIIDKAKGAGLSPMEALGVPGKFKNNVEQLSKTPAVVQAFMTNLKTTAEDLAAGITNAAKDGGAK